MNIECWPVEKRTLRDPLPARPQTPPGSPSALGRRPRGARSFGQASTFFPFQFHFSNSRLLLTAQPNPIPPLLLALVRSSSGDQLLFCKGWSFQAFLSKLTDSSREGERGNSDPSFHRLISDDSTPNMITFPPLLCVVLLSPRAHMAGHPSRSTLPAASSKLATAQKMLPW